MELSFKQLEQTLASYLKLQPDNRSILMSRIKQLQRMPFPPGVNVGRGTRMVYTAEHLLMMVTVFELLALGLPAQTACQLVERHWKKFAAGYALAALGDRKWEGYEYGDVFFVLEAFALHKFQFGHREGQPSHAIVCDAAAVPRLISASRVNTTFTRYVFALGGLLKEVLEIASEQAGVKDASTWSSDFHPWLPEGYQGGFFFDDRYPDRSNLAMRRYCGGWSSKDYADDSPENLEEARAFIENDYGTGKVPF